MSAQRIQNALTDFGRRTFESEAKHVLQLTNGEPFNVLRDGGELITANGISTPANCG